MSVGRRDGTLEAGIVENIPKTSRKRITRLQESHSTQRDQLQEFYRPCQPPIVIRCPICRSSSPTN